MNKDIHGVSGAAISSGAAAQAVREVVILYEGLFLKKRRQQTFIFFINRLPSYLTPSVPLMRD